jgi:hypothetical protein
MTNDIILKRTTAWLIQTLKDDITNLSTTKTFKRRSTTNITKQIVMPMTKNGAMLIPFLKAAFGDLNARI